MSGTGMTQELEALAFEDSQGVELTDEEAEESARAYDIAQVVLKTVHGRISAKPHDQNRTPLQSFLLLSSRCVTHARAG